MKLYRLTLPQRLLLAEAVHDGEVFVDRGDTAYALQRHGLVERRPWLKPNGRNGWCVTPTQAGRDLAADIGTTRKVG